MTTANSVPTRSIIRTIVIAWIGYAGLWLFLLVATPALGPIAVALFDLGLFVALFATVIVTARAYFYILRFRSAPAWVVGVSVLSAIGAVWQLWFITSSLPAPF